MKRRQGDRWARAVLGGSCGLRRRTGEPYMQLEEEHDGRYQMRDSRCVRRELRLCCTGRESPVHRRVRSMTPTTNVGLTRCGPKGAEALLHQKGEPRPTLNRQGYSRRGLTHRMEGSHATEGSQRLCCTERGAPSDAEKARRCDWWRDSHCVRRELRLCCTGGESPPCGLMQDAVWRIGRRAPITTEGSQRFCCTGSGSPVRHWARSATRNDRRRRHTATEGSRGSAAPEGEPRPTLNKQRDATDGGTLTASEGSCGSAAPEGRVPLCGLMQGAVWRGGRRAPITTEGSQRLCCTGSGSPVRHRACSATRNDRRRRHTATEGSRGSAAPEGEPRPTLNKQRDATDGGTLIASEGSLRLCCTGRESPPLRLNMRCIFYLFLFFSQWVYYSLSRSFSSFQFLNSSKIAYWAMSEGLYVMYLLVHNNKLN